MSDVRLRIERMPLVCSLCSRRVDSSYCPYCSAAAVERPDIPIVYRPAAAPPMPVAKHRPLSTRSVMVLGLTTGGAVLVIGLILIGLVANWMGPGPPPPDFATPAAIEAAYKIGRAHV